MNLKKNRNQCYLCKAWCSWFVRGEPIQLVRRRSESSAPLTPAGGMLYRKTVQGCKKSTNTFSLALIVAFNS